MFFYTENPPTAIGQRLSADFLLGAWRLNILATFYVERAKSGIDDRHFLYRDDVISGTVSTSFGEVGFHLSWGDWAACSGAELVSDIMG